MFLKSLHIINEDEIIREISFHKGINLIVDETRTSDLKETGNNVGKTTVLRLVHFCLGGDGKNIYEDEEFKAQSNLEVEKFLSENNIIIQLVLKDNLEIEESKEIVIRRNFLKYSKKIQEIDGDKWGNNKEFQAELKRLVFNSKKVKPTFKQIVSKNIRDEKNRLIHTVKVLNSYTSNDEYEGLFLFWLGIDLDFTARKQELAQQINSELKLQTRLKKESSIPQLNQFLQIIDRKIKELEDKKSTFNLNENYDQDFNKLSQTKSQLNTLSTRVGNLQLRKELIQESKEDLEKDFAKIDISKVRNLYENAKALIPDLQKSFEDTVAFHNEMITEKLKFITKELPDLETEIKELRVQISELLKLEHKLSSKLIKTGAIDELEEIITDLNTEYERKGKFEEQKRLWESTNQKIKNKKEELDKINKGIESKDQLIQDRITIFNKYFSQISNKLYGERFVLSSMSTEKGYSLTISSLEGRLGTGKKKGQIASFDLAYIQFADELDIDCLHFILHDQIENVHENQITNLLNEIVDNINCQYILPVLRDKLPSDINIVEFEVLSLAQEDKLFKI